MEFMNMKTESLKNSFRDELEAEQYSHDQALAGDSSLNEAKPDPVISNEARGRVLIRGGQRPSGILGPDAAPLVKPAGVPKAPPEARLLKAGDLVRALGVVYKVRKVTSKDVVMRPARPAEVK
jgi:hypothetical protein